MKRILALAALLVLGFSLLAHSGMLASLFSAHYLPHRYCYLAKPSLVWTNVTTDSLIAASYGLIFGSLFWIAAKLRSLPAMSGYLWIFIAFGTFIVACGATHLMEVVTVWWPVYPLSATVKVICAAASVPTAILFFRVAPAIAANIHRFVNMLSTTQQQKDQAVMALVASEKLAAVGRISAAITHEIRDPLESIGNLLFLLQKDARVPQDLVEVVSATRSEVTRAVVIANDTLSLFSDASTPLQVSLGELVQSVIDLQAAHLSRASISFESRLRARLPITAYPGELRQILINLIQNAAAATDNKGRILVRVQPRSLLAGESATLRMGRSSSDLGGRRSGGFGQRGYSITVADNGSGIERKSRARLFTLFFTTKGERGNGIGLWLVRSMVEKHGGRIAFRSRTAEESNRPGTVFNLWIPFTPMPTDVAPLLAQDSISQRLHHPV